MIYARKINKMPEFYMIFARKIFFPNFRGASALPLPPVSYAYALYPVWKEVRSLPNCRWRRSL